MPRGIQVHLKPWTLTEGRDWGPTQQVTRPAATTFKLSATAARYFGIAPDARRATRQSFIMNMMFLSGASLGELQSLAAL